MHTRHRLSARQVQTLSTPGVISDGGGLYLRVRASGSKSWLYIAYVEGARREFGLGSVLNVSLAAARVKADEMRSALSGGQLPPLSQPSPPSTALPLMTFGNFAEDLIDDIELGFRNDKHRKQWRATLKAYASAIRDRPIGDVSTDDIVSILKPIWLTKQETASRVRGRIERVLDAARAKGLRTGDNPARWRGHLDMLLPRRAKTEQEHHAALPFGEVGAFMADLASRSAMAARALEFTILTAARSGETLGMRWDEVDLTTGIWSVPGARMKSGVLHQVPLSDQASAVLLALVPEQERAADEFVFQGQAGGMLSNMAMSMLLRRMGREGVTVHGFRSTFRDWAGELTSFAREEVEMALAHSIASKTERAYRRGRALQKRRELMIAWAAYCTNTVSDAARASGQLEDLLPARSRSNKESMLASTTKVRRPRRMVSSSPDPISS